MARHLGAGPEHWEKVHGRRSPDELTWYQARPELSLRLIERAGVGLSERVIDVGGGSSLLCDELLQRGFADVTVLDVSSAALAHVGTRFHDDGRKPSLVEGDIGAFRATETFALWHDRAVFHFLTGKEDRHRYTDALHANLGEGGFVVIATFGVHGPETCSGLPVRRYRPEELATALGDGLNALVFEEEYHVTPSGGSQHFLYGLFKRID